MKYMKLGTKEDTFYTEEATRSVLSDVPTDLIIQVNNTRYHLHKFPLVVKCGLIQRLCSDPDHPSPVSLQGLPGDEAAFELCAKFCYGITINLSAHNLVPALAAARFLQMTESVSRANLVMKLETFFNTCILHGWKDAIVTLQSVGKLSGWPDDPRIVQPCIDAVVDKILTHPSKVAWSFTYTRAGYSDKPHRSVPKDWWTEDVSDLDLQLFRSIISAVRSARRLPPALIGEALHVYACKHLPGVSPADPASPPTAADHRALEFIVSMIPSDAGSVSGGFLLRLLKVANHVGASPSVKAELVRRSGQQLDEAAPSDLLFPMPSGPLSYDVGLVEAILDGFLQQFRRREESERMVGALVRVARIFDAYLQVIAADVHLSTAKFVELAESLPGIARQEHDQLYDAIDVYLRVREHPGVSKEEKKMICRVMEFTKLSPDARSRAIRNELLPLRTVVQLLFIEQERGGGSGGASSSLQVPQRSGLRDGDEGDDDDDDNNNKRQGRRSSAMKHRASSVRSRPKLVSSIK